jgi:serine/threonine protein phosphatase PrpC
MQGWRISMEDAHATILDLQPVDGEDMKPAAPDVRVSFFGVYDGHGGDKVALYTGENLHKIIAKQDAFKSRDFEQALKDGFLAIDRAILSGSYFCLALMQFLQLLITRQTRDMRRRFLDVLRLSASLPTTRFSS